MFLRQSQGSAPPRLPPPSITLLLSPAPRGQKDCPAPPGAEMPPPPGKLAGEIEAALPKSQGRRVCSEGAAELGAGWGGPGPEWGCRRATAVLGQPEEWSGKAGAAAGAGETRELSRPGWAESPRRPEVCSAALRNLAGGSRRIWTNFWEGPGGAVGPGKQFPRRQRDVPGPYPARTCTFTGHLALLSGAAKPPRPLFSLHPVFFC